MKKRLLALLLAGVTATAMLTGCTGDAATIGSSAQSDSPEDSSGAIEVELWYSGGKTAADVLQGIVDDFNTSQDVYNVVTNTQADYTETYEKLQAGIAGNNAPDMALLDVDKSRNLYEKGLVTDMSSFIEADADFDKDDYLDVFFAQGELDGAVFALPAYGTTQVMYYNMAAFEAVGAKAEDIKTWQDLAQVAADIAAVDGYEVGWEPMWGHWNLIDASLSNGAQLISDDGATVTINSPEWVEVWESFRGWIHDDKIMKVNSGGQGWEYWYKTIDDVIAGTAGGYTGSSGDQADLDFSIVAAMEQPGFNSNPSAPTADALQFVMLDKSSDEEKQGVFEMMKFFTSPENQGLWSMNTGYIAVRNSVQEDPAFSAYVEENPHAGVPLAQAMHGSMPLYDPTGGKIIDALAIAADKVELEGISAQEALDEAQATAQQALENI